MTSQESSFQSVPEIYIDLLLLEELHCSHSFPAWWLEQVSYTEPHEHESVGASRSVGDATGESDIVLLVADSIGQRCAVLIENKVDAQPQPRQSARYRERGGAGVQTGEWERFITCIVARQSYLDAEPDARGYDCAVSFEAIRDWFEASKLEPHRARYKIALLEAAIDPTRHGYVKQVDPAVTALLQGYASLAAREFPQLSISSPVSGGPGSGWVYFRLPRSGMSLVHKLDRGFVDLHVPSAAERTDELRVANQEAIDGTIELVPTGKSAAFRIRVPPVNRFGSVGPQEDRIRTGLEAVHRLFEFAGGISGV